MDALTPSGSKRSYSLNKPITNEDGRGGGAWEVCPHSFCVLCTIFYTWPSGLFCFSASPAKRVVPGQRKIESITAVPTPYAERVGGREDDGFKGEWLVRSWSATRGGSALHNGEIGALYHLERLPPFPSSHKIMELKKQSFRKCF